MLEAGAQSPVPMHDHLVRAIVEDADLRALAVVSTETCREGVARHRCAPTSARVLSEALTAGILLARLHKLPRRVNLQIECDGPIRGLVVDADSEGGVRGYARVPTVDFPSPEGSLCAPAFGSRGLVNVLREMNPGQWYRGTVELPGRSVARGVEAYLEASEQVESAVDLVAHLGADGQPETCAGVLFQRLPGGNRAALEAVRARLAEGWLAEHLASLAGAPAAGALLDALMGGAEGKGGENLEIFDRSDVAFHCGCDRERVETSLVSLGPETLGEILEEDGRATVTCEFCGEAYELEGDDLRRLRAEAEAARSPRDGD